MTCHPLYSLQFGHIFNQKIENLPPTLHSLQFGRKFNQKIENLPEDLNELIKWRTCELPNDSHFKLICMSKEPIDQMIEQFEHDNIIMSDSKKWPDYNFYEYHYSCGYRIYTVNLYGNKGRNTKRAN